MKNIKILFEAVGTRETVDDIYNNFCENYPEFSVNMTEEEYDFNEETGQFKVLWEGDFEDNELDDDDMYELVRLTHHAEGFYEDTDAEYVHVEVCIDGKWYGRE